MAHLKSFCQLKEGQDIDHRWKFQLIILFKVATQNYVFSMSHKSSLATLNWHLPLSFSTTWESDWYTNNNNGLTDEWSSLFCLKYEGSHISVDNLTLSCLGFNIFHLSMDYLHYETRKHLSRDAIKFLSTDAYAKES